MMRLLKNAVYFEDLEILAVADLHIGYEASLIAGGYLLPRHEKKEIIENFKEIFSELEKKGNKIKEIVICGDLKHAFGGFSLNEWKEVKEILDFISKFGKIILIRGNHDSYLKALEDKYEVRNYYKKNRMFFMHGDKLHGACLGEKIKRIVVGHIHPVVYLSEKAKVERYRAFLIGKWKSKKVVVLPAFNPLIETGFDVGAGIVGDISLKKFEVYVPGKRVDEIYNFGKVGKLMKL